MNRCSAVELDREAGQLLGHDWGVGEEDLVHLASILCLVVLGSHVRAPPKARAKRQVLEAGLKGLLDATRVDLEEAGVEKKGVGKNYCAAPLCHKPVQALSPNEGRRSSLGYGCRVRRRHS